MGNTQSKKNRTETLGGNMGDTQSTANSRTEILDGNMRDIKSTENSRTETLDGNMGEIQSTEKSRTETLDGNMEITHSTENSRTETLDGNMEITHSTENSRTETLDGNMGDTQSTENSRTKTLDVNMEHTQSTENSRKETVDGNMADTKSTENGRTGTLDGNMGDTQSTENGRTVTLNGNMGDIQSTENGRTGTLDGELGNFQCNLPHDLPMKDKRKISRTYQSIKNRIRRSLSFKKVKKKESDLDINIETNDITIKEIQTTDTTNQDMESIDTTRNDTNAINAISEDIGTIKSVSNDIEAIINNSDIDTIDSINKDMQSIGTTRKYIGSIISTIKRIVTINAASSYIGTTVSTNNDIQTIDPITKEMQSIDTTSKDMDTANSTNRDIGTINIPNSNIGAVISTENDNDTIDPVNRNMQFSETTQKDTDPTNSINEDIRTINSPNNNIGAVISTENDIDTIDRINKNMQFIDTTRKYIGSIISTIKRIVTIKTASSNIGTTISTNNDIQTIIPITKEMQSIDTTSKDVDTTNSTIKDSLNLVNHQTEPILSSNNNIAPIHPINMGICTLDEININVIAETSANENITPERSGSTPACQDRNVTLHESDITSKSSVTSQQKHSETRPRSRSDNNLDNREYEEKIKQNRIRNNFYYILSRTPSSLARRSLSHMPLASLFEDVSIALVMIQQCSPVIYSSFCAWLKIAPSDWLKTFLERNGLSIILSVLISSTSRKKDFAEAILDLMVIQCVKRILNSRVGMTYLIDGNQDLVREFSFTMDTGNLMVKNQVLELWSGVCLYSNDGYQLLLSTLDHFKVEKNQRYRFSIIINELRNTDFLGYKTTVLAFINALLIATEDFNQRRNMRNEFIGLGLLEELQLLRYKDNVDDDLLVQIEVFDEYKLKDDDAMISAGGFNLNNHEDVFKAIFNDVAERPEANNFLNILQNLLMINEDNAVSHIVWQSIEYIVQQAVLACNKDQVTAIKQWADGEVDKMKNSLNENEKLSEFDESQKYGISAGLTHQADSEKSSLESKRFTADFSIQTEDTSKIGGYGVPEETGFPPIHPPLPPLFPGMPHPPPAEEMGVSPAHPHPSPPEMGVPPPPSLPEICVPPPPSPVGVGAVFPTPPLVMGAPPPPIPSPEMGVPTSTPPPLGMCVPPPLPPLGTVVPPPPPPPVNGLPPPPLPPPGMGVPPPPPFPPRVHGTPQPPSLPGMAVLPPPPPPGGMGSIPSSPDLMPPLPPSMGQRSVSCPGAIKPHVKMKKLQWNKIPKNMLNRSKSSVWTKVMAVSAFDPDYDIEEKLFCQPVIEKAKPKGETKNVPKYITLLDGKTSMSINIFLRQFKGGPAQVITWIKDGRSKELEGDRLRCLEKLLPEPNVIEELKSFTGDKEKLGPAEKFFLQLLDLPVYKFRISTLILKEDFQTSTESLRPNIDIMKTAINDILSNEVLPELLDLILRVGNFLNYGSRAGNAEAFKITSLLKLTDTRANKPRMNLLHFIVQMAKEKRERLLEFPLKMPKLAEASRLSVDNLEGEVGKLKNSLDTASKKISNFSDDVKEQFGEFIEVASDECGILETSVKEIRQLAFDLAEYLCEDPKKFVLEDNLKVFQQFSEALVKAKEENEQFERLEEYKRKQEEKAAEEKVRREKLGIKDEPKKGRGKIPPPKEEKCIIDSLLDEVKKGFPLKKLNMKRESIGEQMPYQIQRKESGQSERFEPKVQKWRAIALLLATVPK